MRNFSSINASMAFIPFNCSKIQRIVTKRKWEIVKNKKIRPLKIRNAYQILLEIMLKWNEKRARQNRPNSECENTFWLVCNIAIRTNVRWRWPPAIEEISLLVANQRHFIRFTLYYYSPLKNMDFQKELNSLHVFVKFSAKKTTK